MELKTDELTDWLDKLTEKYGSPEDAAAALEGLYHSKGVHYAEYIHMDALLGLQHTRTNIDDELIFIISHQIIELYFKLIINEASILTDLDRKEFLSTNAWMKRLGRINAYYDNVAAVFDILMPGQEETDKQMFSTEEFKKFRLALIPASGFQSVQFRVIELMMTRIHNLVAADLRHNYGPDCDIDEALQSLYWRTGGRHADKYDEKGDNKKTQTLIDFEERNDELIRLKAHEYEKRNVEYIYSVYMPENEEEKKSLAKVRDSEIVKNMLKNLDENVNVRFRRRHMGLAAAHISKINKGTGGTNYKDYLRWDKQLISFFPTI